LRERLAGPLHLARAAADMTRAGRAASRGGRKRGPPALCGRYPTLRRCVRQRIATVATYSAQRCLQLAGVLAR
jgi:hypothetical protein